MTSVGDQVELTIGEPAPRGECVARGPDGRVVFVRHALPGERVCAVVTEEHRSFLRADVSLVVDPSPDRVVPPCPRAGPGGCGGCDLQHVSLSAQRTVKTSVVATQLRRIAGVEVPVVIEAPPPSDGLGWRTRLRLAVDEGGRVGLRRHRSHEVEPVQRCLVVHPLVEEARESVQAGPGPASVVVDTDPATGARVAWVEPPGATGRTRLVPHRSTARGGLVTDRPVAQPIERSASGHRYRVSPGVFWQAHMAAPDLLVGAVLEAARMQPGERVADLYSGAGLFAVPLAKAVGPEGSVVAVERSATACADAVHNTVELSQVTVVQAPVAPRVLAQRVGRADVVVLDPSRKGAGAAVMRAVAALRPRVVVSVSCDA
ncbi:MAG: class I SAM-dependent RNA methyltransferase, partial [Acidimicrobiales bacterium]